MSSRKLRVETVDVEHKQIKPKQDSGLRPKEYSVVKIKFSRKLTKLEVSGITAVLEGEIK